MILELYFHDLHSEARGKGGRGGKDTRTTPFFYGHSTRDGCSSKENLSEQSALLMNAMYIIFL